MAIRPRKTPCALCGRELSARPGLKIRSGDYPRRCPVGKHGDDSKATSKGSQGGGKHEGTSKDGKDGK